MKHKATDKIMALNGIGTFNNVINKRLMTPFFNTILYVKIMLSWWILFVFNYFLIFKPIAFMVIRGYTCIKFIYQPIIEKLKYRWLF